jgi:uncharacterized protein (TIGR03382 family)
LPFDDPGWVAKNPGNGVIIVDAPNDSLTVIGDFSGLQSSFTGLNNTLDCGDIPGLDCVLNFTLDFYVSSDNNLDDFPALKISLPGLPDLILFLPDENGDVISNLNEQFVAISYAVNLGPSLQLQGASFGLGVFSLTGTSNAGIAKYTDVSVKKVPVPGTLTLLGAAGLVGGGRRRRAA